MIRSRVHCGSFEGRTLARVWADTAGIPLCNHDGEHKPWPAIPSSVGSSLGQESCILSEALWRPSS
jgi:hypothetical protein